MVILGAACGVPASVPEVAPIRASAARGRTGAQELRTAVGWSRGARLAARGAMHDFFARPVDGYMSLALEKTWHAVPPPKIVVAVGACAISGGPFLDHPQQRQGAGSTVPVDLFIPGCPPHPITILDGLLRMLGRLEREERVAPGSALPG